MNVSSRMILSSRMPLSSQVTLSTPRLVLRRFVPEDLVAFAAMNADPVVMRHFPAPLSLEQSNALMRHVDERFDHDGFGWFVVETRSDGAFVGCVGLLRTPFAAHFTPCVEVDWRLARSAWGQGFATEAARAVLTWGTETFGLQEVVSFTYRNNWPSRRVMERLGMQHDPKNDFDHPRLAPGHPLRPHVLYKWRAAHSVEADLEQGRFSHREPG